MENIDEAIIESVLAQPKKLVSTATVKVASSDTDKSRIIEMFQLSVEHLKEFASEYEIEFKMLMSWTSPVVV